MRGPIELLIDRTPGKAKPLYIRAKSMKGMRYWLKEILPPRTHIQWSSADKCFTVAGKYYWRLIDASVNAFGSVRTHEKGRIGGFKCDIRCREAHVATPCDCSCGGENHGQVAEIAGTKMFQVSDVTLIHRGDLFLRVLEFTRDARGGLKQHEVSGMKLD